MDLYGFVFLFLSDHSILSRINGQFYCAMSSEDHNVSAASLKKIPFTISVHINQAIVNVSLAIITAHFSKFVNFSELEGGKIKGHFKADMWPKYKIEND